MTRAYWKFVPLILVAVMTLEALGYYPPHRRRVFEEDTNGYYCYRIPTIVRSTSGTLLAIVEGRVDSCSDMGNIDILCKRSTDNGINWSSNILIDSYGSNRLHNPTPVVDQDNGRIWVFFCVNGCTIAYKYSDNNGVTWSNYAEIPSAGYPTDVDLTNGSIHTGPCHGIQLQRGANAGRLVIPYRYRTSGGTRKIRLLYSDNNGSSWSHSGRIMATSTCGINEVSIEEMTNGDIYFNMRNQTADVDSEYYRIVTKTSDFLTSYDALALDTELPDPIVHGSLLKYASTDLGDAYNQILFANPATKTVRRYMTIRSSFNEAGSWSEKKMLIDDYVGYSDMVDLNNGYVGILYESGASDYWEKIDFVYFNDDWLTDSEVLAMEFEDYSVGTCTSGYAYNSICYALDGSISGTVKCVNGPDSDTALEFGTTTSGCDTTTTDYIVIDDSYANNVLDFDYGETFWIEAKFKTTYHGSGGSTGSGSLVAKDSGTLLPSWWLRVQDGKLKFLICDGNVERSVTSSINVNDGSWHHILVGRDADDDELQIYIDDVIRGYVSDTTTASLKNSEDICIGNFNNASRQFKGAISYVRIHFVE